MRRWLAGIGLVLLAAGAIWLRLTYVHYFPLVPDEIGGPPASPPVLAAFGDDPPVATVGDWESRRAPRLRAAFAETVYGPMPPALPGRVLTRLVLPDKTLAEGARLQVPLTQTAATRQLMAAAQAQGDGGLDYAAIIRVLQRASGLPT